MIFEHDLQQKTAGAKCIGSFPLESFLSNCTKTGPSPIGEKFGFVLSRNQI